ncbi:hypothetical protein Hanom_Chr00s000004g01608411 [Helianthus anomalus]
MVFDVSISMNDDLSTIELPNKLLSIVETIFNIQSSYFHNSGSVSIEFDCPSSFDSI